MSASACPDLKFAKGTPHIVVKRQKISAREAEYARQRKLCHLRSGGRCEVIEEIARPEQSRLLKKRCTRRAVHNHHLIGGRGRRNVGISILSDHRLDVCQRCHQDIGAELLVPTKRDDCFDAAAVTYTREK